MIAFDCQLDERSNKFLLEQAKNFPNEVRTAFMFACGIVQRVMRGRMSGKNKNIARWDAFTAAFSARSHVDYRHTFGGKIMYPRGRQISMQQEGDRVRVGWIGALESAAIVFQTGGTKSTSPGWRRARYAEGLKPFGVPKVSVTPERPVVGQTQDDTSRHMADWTLGAFEKVLRGRVKSWEIRYSRNRSTKMGAAAAGRIAKAVGGIRALEIARGIKTGDFG